MEQQDLATLVEDKLADTWASGVHRDTSRAVQLGPGAVDARRDVKSLIDRDADPQTWMLAVYSDAGRSGSGKNDLLASWRCAPRAFVWYYAAVRCTALQGRAHALRGDRRACGQTCAVAETTLDRAVPADEPAWIRFFTAEQLSAEMLYMAGDLDRQDEVQRLAPIVLTSSAGMERRRVCARPPSRRPIWPPRATPVAMSTGLVRYSVRCFRR